MIQLPQRGEVCIVPQSTMPDQGACVILKTPFRRAGNFRMLSNDKGDASGATMARPSGESSPYGLARIILVTLLVALIVIGPGLTQLLVSWWLPLIGIGGALVANSTGIGGGIVFVPAFDHLGLAEDQSVYMSDVGHIGEQDAIINIEAGLEQGRLRPGDTMAIIAAGIGYVWGGAIVEWGPAS